MAKSVKGTEVVNKMSQQEHTEEVGIDSAQEIAGRGGQWHSRQRSTLRTQQ